MKVEISNKDVYLIGGCPTDTSYGWRDGPLAEYDEVMEWLDKNIKLISRIDFGLTADGCYHTIQSWEPLINSKFKKMKMIAGKSPVVVKTIRITPHDSRMSQFLMIAKLRWC